jgi:hypothetical protein
MPTGHTMSRCRGSRDRRPGVFHNFIVLLFGRVG